MKFVPHNADHGEEYHDNIDDAIEALRSRIDPTSRKMLTHLTTLISYDRGNQNESIRNLARDLDKATSPRGIVAHPDHAPIRAVWWDGKELHYTLAKNTDFPIGK